MEQKVSLEESGEEGTLFIELDGKRAVLDFMKGSNEVRAVHTYTPPEFRGMGLAARLVQALIDYCKERKLRIYPSCAYVVSFFEKRQELSYMLSDDYPLKKHKSQ